MTDDEVIEMAGLARSANQTVSEALNKLALEVLRLREMIDVARENTDGGCAFCRRDPHIEGHAEDCAK